MRKIEKTARPGWFVSLLQTKNRKPEISAPQAVCDVVMAAPPGRRAFFRSGAGRQVWPGSLDTGVGARSWIRRWGVGWIGASHAQGLRKMVVQLRFRIDTIANKIDAWHIRQRSKFDVKVNNISTHWREEWQLLRR